MDSLPFMELLFQHSLAMLAPYGTPFLSTAAHLPHLNLHHEVLAEVVLLLLAKRRKLFEFSPDYSELGISYYLSARKAVLKTKLMSRLWPTERLSLI
jgi:hypothetical protein